MKVLVPFCPDFSLPDLNPFRDRIELYGGFMDEGWEAQYQTSYGLNRMSSFRQGANFASFRQWLEAAAEAADMGIPVNTVLNALHYDDQQRAFIRDAYLQPLRGIPGMGIITSDIRLVSEAHGLGLRTSVSTIAGVYHAGRAAQYRDAGADSIILPRELTLEEIDGIMRSVPGVAWEVFLMSSGCRFSDAVCMGCHIPRQGGLCQLLDHSGRSLEGDADFAEMSHQRMSAHLFTDLFMKDACGLCALYRLEQMGVQKLKIVGRSAGQQHAMGMLSLIVRNIDIARESASEAEYLRRMIMPDRRDLRCTEGFNCYYPEIRFP
ncbi:MAG: U32 family peptidase [Clostridia bacterium]|nr:U32 family peptidase [Clostridia bacterium]